MRRVALSLPALAGLFLVLIMAISTMAGPKPKCQYCGGLITDSYTQYNGYFYHSDCFTKNVAPRCDVCNKPLTGRWVVYENKNYHQHCYEARVALRCSVCGEIIEGEYLVDHWGNKYHAYHQAEIATCSFCGRLLSDPAAGGGNRFDDTHHICFKCNQQAIHDEKAGHKKLNEVRNLLEKAGIVIDHQHIEFELVSRNKLAQLVGRRNPDHFGLTHFEKTSYFGLLSDRMFTIYILRSLPPMHYVSTAAHELMHVWQFLNTPEEGEAVLVEGSCNYAALLALRQINDDMARYVVRQLHEDPDPVYGEGFRRVRKLVDNRGIEYWLQHLQFDPEFPIGY